MPPDAPAPRLALSRLAPPLIAAGARLLRATWRVRYQDRDLLAQALAAGPVVLAFWHGEQLPMVPAHAGLGFVGLASRSRDGELLARVITRLGYGVVRGSASRGGLSALRACIAAIQAGNSPALAVDGPRGPWREPHPGAVALAAATGRPILYGAAAARPGLRLRSWDRFLLPLPGARVQIAYGRMEAPLSTDRGAIEAARQELRERMRALSSAVESSV